MAPTTSWTGEDSNLRSPQGAADLQSAAINHSATCAHRAEQIVRPGIAISTIKEPLTGLVSHQQESSIRRALRLSRKIDSWKLLLGSVLSESSATCLACSCCYAFGALNAENLELAKGFEPPTL